jgi:hypothetical protein
MKIMNKTKSKTKNEDFEKNERFVVRHELLLFCFENLVLGIWLASRQLVNVNVISYAELFVNLVLRWVRACREYTNETFTRNKHSELHQRVVVSEELQL